MRRVAAARAGDQGRDIATIPLLAARLAGGFRRPADRATLVPLVSRALAELTFEELEPVRTRPGMARAVLASLERIWAADVSFDDPRVASPRLSDLADIDAFLREHLPTGAWWGTQAIDLRVSRRGYRQLQPGQTAIRRLGDDRIVQIGANFRCQPGIIEYVNAAFQPVLDADGQPSYGALTATREGPLHRLPPASQVTIGDGQKASMAQQRDDEAAIVAQICSQLIGAIEIEDEDTGKPRLLEAGDIALLAPTGTDLWRYERALESIGLAVASQAGKALLLQQETQDILALLRTLADSRDRVAFGAFMRGPMVGLADEELLDIAEEVYQAGPDASPTRLFDITTPPGLVSHRIARSVLEILQWLRARVNVTTPSILLAEAIEQLQLPCDAVGTRRQ